MSGERAGVLFGELRSLLSEEASHERFRAVVLVLSGLRREAPERFEVEVLPYASAVLERWYVKAAPLDFSVTGRVALEALRADVSWLRVVRALNLSEERTPEAALDALLACTQLTRLEVLAPPERLSSAGMRRLVSSPLMSRLAGFRIWSREVGAELEAWVTQPPERLRMLDMLYCQLDERIVAPLLVLSGQLEQLALDFTTMEGLERLLREGSWGALKTLELPKGSRRADCEALEALTRRTSLEVLTARDVRWPADAAHALWRAAGLGGIRQLTVMAEQGAPALSLDAILSGPMGPSLELLEIQYAAVTGAAAQVRCPQLATLRLKDLTPEAMRWLMAQELPALRTVELGSLAPAELTTVMARLCEAPRGLDKLTVSSPSGALNDAGALWHTAQALDLETLWLFMYGAKLEAQAAALMRDTIEQMPRLKNFYISPDILSPEALEVLRGSRAATLLKIA
jgi:hypothetical protein